LRSSQPSPAPRAAARPSPAPKPAPPRPARQIPSISPIALQNSTKCRLEGTAHFKRGDFAAAHASYTSSLTAIPQDHPLTIVLLCNRALTALKTGEPRQAVEDADTAIRLIGPGKGEGEHVELQGSGDTPGEKRDMRDLYGKALTRKAEALEQMEKWADAAAVWQLCVEAGLGGATATAGRQRCQKALAPKPTATPTARPASTRPAAPPRPRPSASATPQPQKSSEAVERLRAAHKAAEKEGDEKIALTDKVDARIAAWRDGKRDNLRALLSSLDNVLWEGSGWKKVGLHELVVANKVKIVYMKAIAKTHPDKVSFFWGCRRWLSVVADLFGWQISQDATTEVRMIAGTVFSTLNEAWDKFKAENNM
jgi:tetratricopeptide (TPR) repeat protein